MSHPSQVCVFLLLAALFGTGETESIFSGAARIIGGSSVSIDNYPYQLSLRVNGYHVCGATVIHPNWALSAAHCAQTDVSTLSLRSGSSFRTLFWCGTLHTVTQKIIHPSYNNVRFDYDVVLLKVSPAFSADRSISLPFQDSLIPDGTSAVISGWGRTSTSGLFSFLLPEMLQAVTVRTISQSSCNASYAYVRITDRMLCAGEPQGGKDYCQGDNGGPLVATLSGTKKLVGVASFGATCAVSNLPGVYTRVPAIRIWILTATSYQV